MGVLSKYYFKKGPPPPNFFIGGVSGVISTTSLVAYELGVSFYKVKNFQIHGDDISFHIPSNMVQVQLRFRSAAIQAAMTYFYDVDGVVRSIGQGFSQGCSKLKRLWVPNCSHFSAPSGYYTLLDTGITGFAEYPTITGNGGNSNHIFRNSKITHMKYPNMVKIAIQWSNSSGRYNHQSITTLQRLYMPKLTSIDTYDGLTQSDRGFSLIPSGTIVYLPPYMETNRLAEIYVRTIGTLAGDVVNINGLGYTATTGPTTSTAFNIGGDDISKATNLTTSINTDARTGTLGDVFTRHQQSANYVIIKQSLTGTTGNTTTFSVSNATRLVTPTGSTFNYGGTPDRTIPYWVSRGAEIRYITGTTTPDAVVDLVGVNITSTTIDLNFTPPSSPDRPLDFYEVWINDGVRSGSTIWQDYVPHQEIAGSGSTVTNLETGTTYTIRVKAADTLYNVSDFSNTITGTTL